MGLTEMTDMEENRNRDLGRRKERGRRGIKRAEPRNQEIKRGSKTKDTIESSSLSTALIGPDWPLRCSGGALSPNCLNRKCRPAFSPRKVAATLDL
jgi:hypothetical protein